MQIGILGAGHVGLAVGRRLTGAGHRVMLSSARGPHALTPVAQDIGAEAASVTEAAAQELVLLALPWPAVPDALDSLPDWQGRILVDATNPFVALDPLQLADLEGRSASVVVAEHAPGARVVKAFNSITMANFEKGPRQGDARRVLFVSGDDVAANDVQRGCGGVLPGVHAGERLGDPPGLSRERAHLMPVGSEPGYQERAGEAACAGDEHAHLRR